MTKKRKKPAKNKIDRLATTVRADDATILVGNAGATVKAKSTPKNGQNRFVTGLRKVAKTAFAKGQIANKAAFNKITKKVPKPAAPKPRRSRLPYLVAVLLGFLAGGGYYLYESVNLPNVNVTKTIETTYNDWFKKVSSDSTVKKHSAKKKYVKKKSISSKKYTKKTTKPKNSITKKLTKSQQKKKWAKKLATLEQKSKRKYKKASSKYRKNRK